MSLKVGDLASDMIAAAKAPLADDWPEVRDYAESEFKSLARTLNDIVRLAEKDKITAAEAKSLLRIHRNTTLTVLLTVKGLGVLAAERAINAALKAVAGAVNRAAPFRIL